MSSEKYKTATRYHYTPSSGTIVKTTDNAKCGQEYRARTLKLLAECTCIGTLVIYFWGAMPPGLWDLSSPARDWTQASAVKIWNLNHWVTRELPRYTLFYCALIFFFFSLFGCFAWCDMWDPSSPTESPAVEVRVLTSGLPWKSLWSVPFDVTIIIVLRHSEPDSHKTANLMCV